MPGVARVVRASLALLAFTVTTANSRFSPCSLALGIEHHISSLSIFLLSFFIEPSARAFLLPLFIHAKSRPQYQSGYHSHH